MSRMVHVRATQDMGDFPDREALIDHSQVGGWAAAMHDLGYALVEVRPIEDVAERQTEPKPEIKELHEKIQADLADLDREEEKSHGCPCKPLERGA